MFTHRPSLFCPPSFRLSLLSFGLLASANSMAADGELFDLLDMSLAELLNVQVVTAASGYEQKLSDAPASVTIVAREQWRQSGATTLEDAIEPVAGVHVGKNNATQGNPLVSIRGIGGFTSRNVKMLLDGLPIEDAQLGGRSGHLSAGIGNAKRIEVVKGPGSVVYGADAFAGIINVVLPEAGDSSVNQINARAGSEGHQDLIAAFGGSFNQHKWFLGFEYSEASEKSGNIVEQDLQTVFDSIFMTQASLAPTRLDEEHQKYDITARYQWHALKLDFFYVHAEGTAGTGAANAMDERGWLENTNQHTRLRFNFDKYISLPGSTELTLIHTYGYLKNRWDVFPQNSLFPVGDDGNLFTAGGGLVFFPDGVRGTPSYKENEYIAELTHLVDLGPHKLRSQVGYSNERQKAAEKKNFGPGVLDNINYPGDGSPYVSQTMVDVSGAYLYVPPEISRNYYWLSIQDEWKINDWVSSSAGIRYDDYSDFGATSNPRVSVHFKPLSKLDLSVFYGSAFRAPKQGELEIRNNPSLIGNKDLKPETIDTLEFALAYQATKNLLLQANIYKFEASDLVMEVALEDTPSIKQYENIESNSGKGAELALTWRSMDRLSVKLNASYNDVKLSNDDSKPYIPKHMVFAGFNWQVLEQLNTDLGFKRVMDISRVKGDPRPDIKDYNWVTAALTWQSTKKTELSLSAENLTNEAARAPSSANSGIVYDLPYHGRQYLLSVAYSF
ncbi:TonB-dependent receptor plug domain-containing protein [Agaribacterium haliotis]|uniref:TonB-dependent receptor plug domain-containing protein n=1 Tax=Agaribacterium haliotis TaxID=2013869 RepID=UPI000BB581CD|nr:TonB-dependent receptor [Agaribacterium haliotis]